MTEFELVKGFIHSLKVSKLVTIESSCLIARSVSWHYHSITMALPWHYHGITMALHWALSLCNSRDHIIQINTSLSIVYYCYCTVSIL